MEVPGQYIFCDNEVEVGFENSQNERPKEARVNSSSSNCFGGMDISLLLARINCLEAKVSKCLENQDSLYQVIGKVQVLDDKFQKFKTDHNNDIAQLRSDIIGRCGDQSEIESKKFRLPASEESNVRESTSTSSVTEVDAHEDINDEEWRPVNNDECLSACSADEDFDADVKVEPVLPVPPTPAKSRLLFKCSLCPKEFTRRYDVKRHEITHARKRKAANEPSAQVDNKKPPDCSKSKLQFRCARCSKNFESKVTLLYHFGKYHATDMQLRCKLCGRSFKLIQKLAEHYTAHHATPNGIVPPGAQCKECGLVFRWKHHLSKHLLDIHSIGDQPTCNVCQKTFKNRYRLVSHRRIKHGLLPGRQRRELYTLCTTCGKRICTKTLRLHMQTHTGERNHKCEICGQSFITSTVLKDHIYKHTGERNFLCPHCGAAFARPSNLSNHITKVHTMRPFKCDTCTLSFSKQRYLDEHKMRGHASLAEGMKK